MNRAWLAASYVLKTASIGVFVWAMFLPAITILSPVEPRWGRDHGIDYEISQVSSGWDAVRRPLVEVSEKIREGRFDEEPLCDLLLATGNLALVATMIAMFFFRRRLNWNLVMRGALAGFTFGTALTAVLFMRVFPLLFSPVFILGGLLAITACVASLFAWELTFMHQRHVDWRVGLSGAAISFTSGIVCIPIYNVGVKAWCAIVSRTGHASIMDNYPILNFGYGLWIAAPAVLFLSELAHANSVTNLAYNPEPTHLSRKYPMSF